LISVVRPAISPFNVATGACIRAQPSGFGMPR